MSSGFCCWRVMIVHSKRYTVSENGEEQSSEAPNIKKWQGDGNANHPDKIL